jgi:hypothetical protein
MFENPEVIAAVVIGGCAVLASTIAAIAAAFIGKRFQNQNLLKADLRQALSDIEFLLAVEKEHGEIHRKNTGGSNVRTVRSQVKSTGLEWSRRFTPGRAKDLKSRI